MYEEGYRSLIRYSIFLLLIPGVYFLFNYSMGYVSGPTLYDGDIVEERPCRACCPRSPEPSQEGEAPSPDPAPRVAMPPPEPGTCTACGGRRTVKVVKPGPSRPTRFWGAVLDRKLAPEDIDFHCPDFIALLPFQAAFLPPEKREITGALPNAHILFLGTNGEAIEAKTDNLGRFTQKVPPGTYRVKVSAGGFATLETKLIVDPLVAPVWLDREIGHPGEESGEERRSSLGLALVITLVRGEEEGAGLQVFPVP